MHASCSCGQLFLDTTGDPVRVSICHCLACQRRTGSVFAAQARFHRDQISGPTGASTSYVRVGDEGGAATFHFCPVCGCTVWYAPDAGSPPNTPECLVIPVGAFADPGFPAPEVSVYEARRHAWVVVPEDIVHWD